jgi:hypothetical protein
MDVEPGQASVVAAFYRSITAANRVARRNPNVTVIVRHRRRRCGRRTRFARLCPRLSRPPDTVTSTVGFLSSGKLRALAVTGKQRSPSVPDLPTVAEAGVPGFDVGAWFGILVPAGTPRAIINRLNGEIVRVTRSPEAREQFVAQGAEPVGSTPEEFRRHIATEVAKWAKVAKAAKMRAD